MWCRKSSLGLAEISSFVFLVLFKDGGRRVSPRFHLFVSDVDQGNRGKLGSKFPCVEFIIASCSEVKILWLYNLKLEQAMRNLPCSNQ